MLTVPDLTRLVNDLDTHRYQLAYALCILVQCTRGDAGFDLHACMDTSTASSALVWCD